MADAAASDAAFDLLERSEREAMATGALVHETLAPLAAQLLHE